jgi:uncharacterized OB-fold protein
MAQRRPDRTLGGPHDIFWEWCAKRELRLQRCGECSLFQWPPVESCEGCVGESFTWVRVGGNGTLRSWCIFERSYYEECPPPWSIIYVELDEGPMFISNPAEDLNTDNLQEGLRVQLSFLECEDSKGMFLLPLFGQD